MDAHHCRGMPRGLCSVVVSWHARSRHRLAVQQSQLSELEEKDGLWSISIHGQDRYVFEEAGPRIRQSMGCDLPTTGWVQDLFHGTYCRGTWSSKLLNPNCQDVSRKVNRRSKAAINRKITKHAPADLMADLVQLHHDKPDFTDMYLRKMAITNFGAGHETMASTLTSVMAMLGLHPDVQAKARNEILNESGSQSFGVSTQLEYTRAATKEAMRLYPVIAMALPREAPSSGLLLHGYFIPGGTTIGCNPVSLHRNEQISGSRPNAFDPERWLADEQQLRIMDRYNLNWGGGSRTCPGRHLADMIVVKTITKLLEHFRIEVNMENESMQPSYFLSMMTNVTARFIPIEESQNTAATKR